MTKSNTIINDEIIPSTYTNITLLRLPQVLEIIPVSKSTWWKGCKEGRYPQPVHPSPRTTAWRKCDIDALVAQFAEGKAV